MKFLKAQSSLESPGRNAQSVHKQQRAPDNTLSAENVTQHLPLPTIDVENESVQVLQETHPHVPDHVARVQWSSFSPGLSDGSVTQPFYLILIE